MLSYVIMRLANALSVIIAIIVIIFLLVHVMGDPARLILPLDTSEETYLAFRHKMGLDDPLAVQFSRFMLGALHGDFGESWWQDLPALPLVIERGPATLKLVLGALLLSLITGVPAGIITAARPGSLADRAVTVASLMGVSVPSFWLALLLMMVFAVRLGWFFTSGYGSFRHIVLPVVALAALTSGRVAQVVRSAMREELLQRYVVTAKSKGVSRRVILWRHVLKNAAIPIITMFGWESTSMLAGSTVIVETVFAWPGLGYLAMQAIQRRDLPLIMADVFVIASAVTLVNLIVDLSYALVDPRVRYGS